MSLSWLMAGHIARITIALLFKAIYILHVATETEASRYITIDNEYVTVLHDLVPIPNAYNQCYVNVYVYTSSQHSNGLENAIVTILSEKQVIVWKDKNETVYEYYSSGRTNAQGHACVLALCQVECEIFVEKNGTRILTESTDTQLTHLPLGFRANVMTDNEIINFYSFILETFDGKSGPVFRGDDKLMCTAGKIQDYRFTFSQIVDQLVSTLAPLNTTDLLNNATWVYGLPGYRKYCYLKIRIKTKSTQAIFTATSQMNNSNGKTLGTYISGPKYDMSQSDTTTKATCLKYRCPVVNIFTAEQIDTFVSVNITVPGSPNGCCVRNTTLRIARVRPSTFAMTFEVGLNYGPSHGEYKGDTDVNARARCYTGQDFIGTDYSMNVNTGAAFEYDCTDNCYLNNPVVVG